MARVFDLARRFARAMHPFVLVTTRGASWPLDTDKAGILADRLWETDGGRELSKSIHHAIAIRGYLDPGESDVLFLQTISEWVDEVGEEHAGKQMLDLRAALRSDVGGRADFRP